LRYDKLNVEVILWNVGAVLPAVLVEKQVKAVKNVKKEG